MDYNLTCGYCNHKWNEFFLNQRSLRHAKCKVCKDENLIIRESKSEVVDYYVGCPPFPSKHSKSNDKIDITKDENVSPLDFMPWISPPDDY